MAEPFLGEIRMFGFGFAPSGWATCDGQILSISQNQALFALLGTMYGGNGSTTFGLPDLRGRAMLHKNNAYVQGTSGGLENVSLLSSQMPSHAHTLVASGADATTGAAQGNSLAKPLVENAYYAQAGSGQEQVTLSGVSLAMAGSSTGHNNMQPSLVINFCIALLGLWPTRS